jgi:hypothetical protein
LWAEDNPFPECDDGVQPTRYIRADLAALSASPAPAGDLVERAARIIDHEAFDHPTIHPQHLTARRTKAVDRARAVIAAMQPGWRDKPHCQSCGGEIQGWTCQGCGLTFRENEAGRLVAEPFPAPLGVGG